MQNLAVIFSKPATVQQQKILYVVIAGILALLCGCYLYYLRPLGFPLDDPYIVLHNAQVLHWGHDRNYPGVPALDGSTSAVHLALVALFMFWLTPIHALVSIMWLAIFAYALGLLRLAFCYSASVLQALLCVLLGLTVVDVPLQLLNGMETGLAMAAIVWLFVLLQQPPTLRVCVLRNFSCGLLPFIRPELVLLSILIFIYFASQGWRQKKSHRAAITTICIDGLIILLSALPWLLWYQISTGNFYPETIHAKQYFMAATCLPFAIKLYFFKHALVNFSGRFNWIGFAGAMVLLLVTPLGRIGLLFMLGFLTAYFIDYPSGLFANYLRYFYILVPILLYSFISTMQHSDKIVRISANVFLMLTLLQSLILLPVRWDFYLIQRHLFTSSLTNVADWCNAHLPRNSVILVHDAGYMAYATSFHLIDMVGLKTPSNIYYHKTLTFPSNGEQRDKAIADIIRYNHPQYIVLLKTWETLFGTMIGLQKQGWHFKLLWSEKDAYSVYEIENYN